MSGASFFTLALTGDVMTGRGIDQVLPHPVKPILYEPEIRDARDYVKLAEEFNGPIPHPVDFAYVWGDATGDKGLGAADVRIVNLETSVTRSENAWPSKDIHYRMHPRNVPCLTAARINCCVLANNHVLDWGYSGLAETLRTLHRAKVAYTGAGRNATEATAPATLDVAGKGRVLVFAFGSISSGIPDEWGATEDRLGINLLKDLSAATARSIGQHMRQVTNPGDVVVASIHWGPNWGDTIPNEQVAFAHRLIEEGVAIIHGHSAHHVKASEVYRGRLILYGCGDFLDDYEGIGGYEAFRSDLTLLYLVRLNPRSGELLGVRLVPFQLKRFRLTRASKPDAQWLRDRLNRLGAPFEVQVRLESDDSLTLRWKQEEA